MPLQQLREATPADQAYRFLIHDRDAIFSRQLDQNVRHLDLAVLRTPGRTPQANAICERVFGTLRRESLDFVIRITEHHLQQLLQEWAAHFTTGHPHMSLEPGIPQPFSSLLALLREHQHRLQKQYHVAAWPILGGLHHDYRLEHQAA